MEEGQITDTGLTGIKYYIIKEIGIKDLLYSTGNFTHYLVNE